MPNYSAGTASVEIRPDFSGFIRQLRSDLDRASATFDVEINPDITGFARQLETELQRVDASITVAVRPDLDRAAFDAELAAYRPTVHANVIPALDQSQFAAIEAALDRLARDRTVNIDVDRSGLSRLGSAADSTSNSLTRMSGVRFTGLAVGIAALVPILLGAAGAAGGLVAALGAVGGVGAIGGSGIIGAFSAMKDATKGAGQAAQDHARDLDQVADAQQRVIDAQHNEMDSLDRVEDAQKSLTQARIDAKDAMDNLNLSVKNGALSERGAELAYRRAVVNLRKVQSQARQGKASGLDVESAQLEVDQAAQNITNVRVRNEQTKRQADDANAKGIEGSDQVTSAQQRLEQAQYAAAQAQIQTAQAVRDLARAQEDAAKSGAEASGVTDKFAEALAKLSPAARDFVLQMQALGPVWKDLRLAVQENLFAGLGDAVTQFANNQLPELKNGLSQLATGMNAAIKDTLSSLDRLFTELVNNGTMQAFIDGVNQAMQGMAPFVTGLTDAFIQLGAVVGPHLGPFFAAFGTAISDLAGPLGRIGGVFLDTLTALLPTLTQLLAAMSDGLAPVLPVIGRLFDAIGQALIPLIPPLSQFLQLLGTALADVFNALAPYLPTIAQAFADILAAVAPLIGPLAQLVGVLAGGIAQSVSALATALAPVVAAFADGLRPVVPILADAFAKLTPVLADAAAILGQALAQALETLMPVLPELVKAWTDLFIAVTPLLPPLAELGAQLLPILAEAIVQMSPYLLDLIKHFTQLANLLVPILIPAIQNMADFVEFAGEKISAAWNKMQDGLDRLHTKFIEIINKIKEAWKDLTEVFSTGALGGVGGRVLDKAFELLPGRAGGGAISGPGTSTSDSILARLSDGEYVINAASTAKYRPLIEAINTDTVPGFADGGLAGQRATSWARSHDREPYVYGGLDCSGYLSGIYNQLTGKQTRFVTNSDFAQFGFVKGSNPNGFTIGTDGGSGENGHMAGTLLGTNVESDGSNGIQFGRTAQGASAFPFIWNLPTTVWNPPVTAGASPAKPSSPEAATDPSNYSPTGTYIGPSSADTSKDQAPEDGLPEQYSLQGIFSKAGTILANGLLGFFGLENSVLSSSNVYNRAINTTVDFYSKKGQEQTTESAITPSIETPTPASPAPAATPAAPAAEATRHVYNPSGGAEQWRGTVVTVLRGTGRDVGLADRTLAQIRIESGGNPNAINNTDINAQNGTPSIGLLQVIKPTFDAYADPRYPGTQRDPEPNIAAALNYVDKRYGGAAKIWPTTAGYADGGWVFGRGSSTSDSIPARLSNGEFVVNAAAAAANGEWLQAINAGATLRVPALPPGFGARGGDSSTVRDHSLNIHGDTYVMNPQDFVEAVDRHQSKQAIGLSAALP